MTEPTPYGDPPPVSRAQSPLRRLLAPFLAAGAAVLKFGAVIVKLKFFTVFATGLASVWAYALLYGWQFAIGFVLLIGVHEMGHVVALRARGIDAGLPVFLPFLGAFVSMKEQPRTAYDEAVSGLAGPVAGTLASFAVLGVGLSTDSQLLRVLAFVGFLLNLFNLLPVLPLDGGRTAAALSPRLWFVGLALLVAYGLYRPNVVVVLVLLLGGRELWRRWKGRDTESSRAYYALSAEQRLQIGVGYLGLVAVLIWAMHAYPLPPR